MFINLRLMRLQTSNFQFLLLGCVRKMRTNRCSCCCHSLPLPRIGQFREANSLSITWIFLLLNPQVEMRSRGQYLNKSKTKLIVLSMLNSIILKQFCLFFNANDLCSFRNSNPDLCDAGALKLSGLSFATA